MIRLIIIYPAPEIPKDNKELSDDFKKFYKSLVNYIFQIFFFFNFIIKVYKKMLKKEQVL